MFYLENNWELNSELDENSNVVYYVLHYTNHDYVETENGDYVRVKCVDNKYVLQNEPKEHKDEVLEFLSQLN